MMKISKYLHAIALGAISLTATSCYNAEHEFPDFEGGTTAYFAYQDPVRTLILGNDIWDNSLDNAHKCQIYATMGGAYHGRNAVVDFVVDPTLCDNLFFTDDAGNVAGPVLPMPTDYYSLASHQIPYKSDSRGYVEVQFTDAFFKDPKSAENTYVIPLLMTKADGIDHILTGTPRDGMSPARTNTADWEVPAKDYVLYCVKYMNPWQARYIRRGVDNVIEGTETGTVVRKDFSLVDSDPGRYTENPVNANDEVCKISTKDMNTCIFPVSVKRISKDKDGKLNPAILCNVILKFDGNKCTLSTDDEDATVEGSGEFIVKGTANSEYKDYRWGNMNGEPVDRDILRLSYNVNFKKGKYLYTAKDAKGNDVKVFLDNDMTVSTADTLVVQTRESNKKVFFSPTYVK